MVSRSPKRLSDGFDPVGMILLSFPERVEVRRFAANPAIKFPVPRKIFPDTRLEIPCSVAQGIRLEAIESAR
jgi:hypothetical protein